MVAAKNSNNKGSFTAEAVEVNRGNMTELSQFSRDEYSQSGEDGIIEELLRRISLRASLNKFCVEFGAWDGVHLSNTCNLIRNAGYHGILIEGEPKRAAVIASNFEPGQVSVVEAFVEVGGDNTLDRILGELDVPRDFDVLSIDVDGMDYHIFADMVDHKPKLVCIEFNPTIPNEVNYIQAKNFKLKHGSSASAIYQLAENKGYRVVAATYTNLIMIDAVFADVVTQGEQSLDDLIPAGRRGTCLFIGYNGDLISNADVLRFPWHNIEIELKNLQPLPRSLRVFGGDYGFWRRMLMRFWLWFTPSANRYSASRNDRS